MSALCSGSLNALNPPAETIEMQREIPFISTDFTKSKGLFWMDRAVWQQAHDALLNKSKEIEKAVSLDEVMTLDVLQKVGKVGG